MGNETRQPGAGLPLRGGSKSRHVLLAGLLLGAMFLGAGLRAGGEAPPAVIAQDVATPIGTPEVTATDPCPDELHGPGSEAWVQAELYFSQPRGDAESGTDELFLQFLDEEVTPRFPAGLTLLSGIGQWQGSDGEIGQTRSHVLVILFPTETGAESNALIEEIRDEFETQFDQESVLRADTAAVCTSF